MYKFGTIVLIPFPFTDLSSAKLRPAIILSKNNNNNSDVIVAFISTKITYNSTSIHIQKNTSLLTTSGLKKASEIRLDKIATLNKNIILGELGNLPSQFLEKHKQQFYSVFGF
jgi:mRNA interferase MazF